MWWFSGGLVFPLFGIWLFVLFGLAMYRLAFGGFSVLFWWLVPLSFLV